MITLKVEERLVEVEKKPLILVQEATK